MRTTDEIRQAILTGHTALGIELGSTRIKGVLIDDTHTPIASGSFEWENRLVDKVWTYDLEDAWIGLKACYAALKQDVKDRYGLTLTAVGAMGISGMMHGYIPIDGEGRQLAPFRTWRNTMTGEAVEILSERLHFNIPQRWSIAHLYQSILNGEAHVEKLDYLATLAAYIHWQLTGVRCAGVGEASGMFPIDPMTCDYDQRMTDIFDAMIAAGEVGERAEAKQLAGRISWKLRDVLPKVLKAGDSAGVLTEEGARRLDPSGDLQAGIPLCPPEGDAGTGMTATNSVAPRTGNVSAGTSVFAMIVMEQDLKAIHPEIDVVTTPDGLPVAMVHCNNCTTDINAWVGVFDEFANLFGMKIDRGELFNRLFEKALEADPDCDGILEYNYFGGEPVTGLNEEGRPLMLRRPDSRMTLANLMRANLYGALGTLKVGLDILRKEENVPVDEIYGHGGFFKTPVVGQKILAAAIDAPVSVMKTAGEGGPWGQAILAGFSIWSQGESLGDYLKHKVFAGGESSRVLPDPEDVKGFEQYIDRYVKCLEVERAAVKNLQ